MSIKKILGFIVLAATFASCQESDDTPEAYPDWQNKNEQAFLKIYNDAQDSIRAGKNWRIVKGVYRPDVTDVSLSPTDCVVMQVLEPSLGGATPLATDTVAMHYLGRLIPSTYYSSGLVFDSSYSGSYEAGVSTPYEGKVGSFVEGFATALQYMHAGEHCMVYIPYQLGYGSSAASSIPAYSMLIFDLRLEKFW